MCMHNLKKVQEIARLKKQKMKINQLEKMRFIKVNEQNLTQVEQFQFFRFMCAVTNAFELFCVVYLANIERF